MNKEERLDYIFGNHHNQPIKNRFDWLNAALLGDIKTFIDGIQTSLNTKSITTAPDLSQGGGNLSIPILICTGLELASALYVGNTKYGSGQGYNATENVEKFINRFFSDHARRIPRLIWDGVRNGVDHLFIPKSLQFFQNCIQFTFYIQDSQFPSHVTKSQDKIRIAINSIEFYLAIKQAMGRYKNELESIEDTQCRFVNAWESIENHIQDIAANTNMSAEVEYLLKELKDSDTIKLFGEL